eukprot:jgi/Chrzof1/14322/UNPLg00595.t1
MLKPNPDTSVTEQTGITAAGADFLSTLQPARTCNGHAPLDMKHTLCHALACNGMSQHGRMHNSFLVCEATEQTGITAAGADFLSTLQPAHTCNGHAPLDMKHTLCYVLSGPSMQWHVTAWEDA